MATLRKLIGTTVLGIAVISHCLSSGQAADAPPKKGKAPSVVVNPTGPIHEGFASPASRSVEPPAPVLEAPPKPLNEEIPVEKPDEDNVQWIPGYWDYVSGKYTWVSGVWRIPPPGRQWATGYWSDAGGQWRRVRGFWVPFNANVDGINRVRLSAELRAEHTALSNKLRANEAAPRKFETTAKRDLTKAVLRHRFDLPHPRAPRNPRDGRFRPPPHPGSGPARNPSQGPKRPGPAKPGTAPNKQAPKKPAGKPPPHSPKKPASKKSVTHKPGGHKPGATKAAKKPAGKKPAAKNGKGKKGGGKKGGGKKGGGKKKGKK